MSKEWVGCPRCGGTGVHVSYASDGTGRHQAMPCIDKRPPSTDDTIAALRESLTQAQAANVAMREAASRLGLQCVNTGNYGPLKISPGQCECSTCGMKKALASPNPGAAITARLAAAEKLADVVEIAVEGGDEQEHVLGPVSLYAIRDALAEYRGGR